MQRRDSKVARGANVRADGVQKNSHRSTAPKQKAALNVVRSAKRKEEQSAQANSRSKERNKGNASARTAQAIAKVAVEAAVRGETKPPRSEPQPADLDWDDAPQMSPCDTLVLRWTAKAEDLFQKLAEHRVAQHEVRADLKDGHFYWLAPGGRISAEARAQVLCSWSSATNVVAMAWADPLVRGVGVARIDGMLSERDNVDEEGAWRLAMEAAEASGAAYLYRISAPHVWYFLGLHKLSFDPTQATFYPGTPVGLVLRALREVRQAIESCAEPAAVIRDRLRSVGNALLHQAEYAYRGTDWVARLDRTSKRLTYLSKRVPRASFSSIAAGQYVEDWIDRELSNELIEGIALLEDEWNLFA